MCLYKTQSRDDGDIVCDFVKKLTPHSKLIDWRQELCDLNLTLIQILVNDLHTRIESEYVCWLVCLMVSMLVG